MKYVVFCLLAVGSFVLGWTVTGSTDAKANQVYKFKTEILGEAFWEIKRLVDDDNKVACYTSREMISCVKL